MVKELYHIQLRKAIRLIPRSVCTAATAAGMLCGGSAPAPPTSPKEQNGVLRNRA